jgi:hypothetical protein
MINLDGLINHAIQMDGVHGRSAGDGFLLNAIVLIACYARGDWALG